MMNKNLPTNYIYFGTYSAVLLVLYVLHVFTMSASSAFSSPYFIIYSVCQVLAEVALLVVVGKWIKKFLPKSLYYFFVSMSFLLFLTHVIDFILIRVVDMSFWYAIDFILHETFENFLELLSNTGLSLYIWAFIISSIFVLLPLFAIYLYRVSHRVSDKRPYRVCSKRVMKYFCMLPVVLLGMDLLISPKIAKHEFDQYVRILPWKFTLLSKDKNLVDIGAKLRKLDPKIVSGEYLDSIVPDQDKTAKPNIFLFVVESLRDDFLTEDVSPNLHAFKNENIHFEQSFSNANATILSWYTIFHANYPFYWNDHRPKEGAYALRALKKLGYKIHVHTSAQMKFYNIDQSIFGENAKLVDNYVFHPHYLPVKACDSDRLVMSDLFSDIKKEGKEGNVFIVFLDSTHFEYTWPKDFETKFKPVFKKGFHLKLSQSEESMDEVKNSYRNAIHYVDSMMGQFFTQLKKEGKYDDAVIVFTGDHGDEFYEEGKLYHASHLSKVQTTPPIYYKLGDNQAFIDLENKPEFTSHMDVFPSILEHVLGKGDHLLGMQGKSIMSDARDPFVFSARINWSRAPYEFFLHDGKNKLICQLEKKKDVFNSKKIALISYKDADNQLLEIDDKNQIIQRYETAIKTLFDK